MVFNFPQNSYLTFYLVIALFLTSCSKRDKVFFKVDNNQSGITFSNTLQEDEDFNIIDFTYFYNGGGVALGDVNNDGLPDIYFSGNQVKNKLYLNKGGMKFEDITLSAGVEGMSEWNTGAVMGDVNGDGLMDIYVCAIVGMKGLQGHNELFINNGDNTFDERSTEFGLDLDTYSSTAAFLDYDLDGDLDVYILHHAVHSAESFGHADLRLTRSYETGDKLMRNDDGHFKDVSEEAGIFGGINGYGMGVAVADFNQDNYLDIYISNEFHEDDLYYLNNGDGTFSEQVKESFTHISRYSLGNDAADINNDGLPDLISMDVLPFDEKVLKNTEGDEDLSILKLRTEKYGYHFQFSRNMLQINQGNGRFVEMGLFSGVAATDWSWSGLFADFDQDGCQDLFVSNGLPRRPNDLDYMEFVFSKEIKKTIDATNLADKKAFALMPRGESQNLVFKGNDHVQFSNETDQWLPKELTSSAATALGDLDGDGDLDIVVNNINSTPGIYINQTNEKSNFLKLKLNYIEANKFGIGTKVTAFSQGKLQFRELTTSRGFQASSEPIVHFGFGSVGVVDSIIVVWPDGRYDILRNISTNQQLDLKPSVTSNYKPKSLAQPKNQILTRINNDSLGLDFKHIEDPYADFDRVKLLPYQLSDRGPATAIGDLNNDGFYDIFFGGSKHTAATIFFGQDEKFRRGEMVIFDENNVTEDVAATFGDFNDDGKKDLLVGTGGADFYGKSSPLLNRLYLSAGDGFNKTLIPDYYDNASCVKAFDFDKDGDLDVFIGSQSVSNDFGKTPGSVLLENNNGKLEPVQNDLFGDLGMVTDAIWSDYDGDGHVDLVVVGEWMEPLFIRNTGKYFVKEEAFLGDLSGLWQSVVEFDIDHDGEMDYVLGNWGLNSKFKATKDHPMLMYYGDLDGNDTTETIVSIEKNGTYFPLESIEKLFDQIPTLKKQFPSYKEMAGKSTEEIFKSYDLKKARKYKVTTLATGYLKNEGGHFSFHEFTGDMQLSPIMAMIVYDFNRNSQQELLVAGNYFGVQPYQGRFGSFNGALIYGENKILLGKEIGLELYNKSVRDLSIIHVNGLDYLMVTINNDTLQLYQINR